jgi:hypothetical protein
MPLVHEAAISIAQLPDFWLYTKCGSLDAGGGGGYLSFCGGETLPRTSFLPEMPPSAPTVNAM